MFEYCLVLHKLSVLEISKEIDKSVKGFPSGKWCVVFVDKESFVQRHMTTCVPHGSFLVAMFSILNTHELASLMKITCSICAEDEKVVGKSSKVHSAKGSEQVLYWLSFET